MLRRPVVSRTHGGELFVTISRSWLNELLTALNNQTSNSELWRASSNRWYRNWKLTFGWLLVAVVVAVIGWLK